MAVLGPHTSQMCQFVGMTLDKERTRLWTLTTSIYIPPMLLWFSSEVILSLVLSLSLLSCYSIYNSDIWEGFKRWCFWDFSWWDFSLSWVHQFQLLVMVGWMLMQPSMEGVMPQAPWVSNTSFMPHTTQCPFCNYYKKQKYIFFIFLFHFMSF